MLFQFLELSCYVVFLQNTKAVTCRALKNKGFCSGKEATFFWRGEIGYYEYLFCTWHKL